MIFSFSCDLSKSPSNNQVECRYGPKNLYRLFGMGYQNFNDNLDDNPITSGRRIHSEYVFFSIFEMSNLI
jgi:hypothetical protein